MNPNSQRAMADALQGCLWIIEGQTLTQMQKAHIEKCKLLIEAVYFTPQPAGPNSRDDVLEEAALACISEQVEALECHPEDVAYNVACSHCADALRALKNAAPPLSKEPAIETAGVARASSEAGADGSSTLTPFGEALELLEYCRGCCDLIYEARFNVPHDLAEKLGVDVLDPSRTVADVVDAFLKVHKPSATSDQGGSHG